MGYNLPRNRGWTTCHIEMDIIPSPSNMKLINLSLWAAKNVMKSNLFHQGLSSHWVFLKSTRSCWSCSYLFFNKKLSYFAKPPRLQNFEIQLFQYTGLLVKRTKPSSSVFMQKSSICSNCVTDFPQTAENLLDTENVFTEADEAVKETKSTKPNCDPTYGSFLK